MHYNVLITWLHSYIQLCSQFRSHCHAAFVLQLCSIICSQLLLTNLNTPTELQLATHTSMMTVIVYSYVQRNMQYKTIDTYPFPCRWQSFGPIAVLKIQKRVLHGTVCTILTPLFTSYLYGMTAQQYGFIHRLALLIASYIIILGCFWTRT